MSANAAANTAPQAETTGVRDIETHVSVLTFDGDLVHKRKKAVRFPFLDLSTPELRLSACRQELDLNRRLAPDIYLKVEEVLDATGNLVDAEVVMRRLPDERRLATLVTSRADVAGELTEIAHVLAAFHSTAKHGPDVNNVATPDGLRRRWDADLDEWEPLAREILGFPTLVRQRSLIHRYIAGRTALLAQRVEGGHIVDGHGDLLAEDIFCLPDGPRILDCLEFDPPLRYGDELADVAFLAMDLESLGRPDLAEFFARTYQRFAGEHFPASLLHLYIAQRAMVRSKVACLRVAQGDTTAIATARTHLNLCVRHLEFARPLLIVIGGPPGSGKSTLAARLATTMGWVHLRSDEVRRDVAGVTHDHRGARDPLDEGIYGADDTDHTYNTLMDRSKLLLGSGFSVIVDATFGNVQSRRRAQTVARASYADIVELECHAPMDVIQARVQKRGHLRDDLSEAGSAVALALNGRQQLWPGAHPIDTTMPEAAQMVRCLRHVGETRVAGEAR